MNFVFARDYTIRKGSTFSHTILLEDIYVFLDSEKTYTVEGGMILVSDSEQVGKITGVINLTNTEITITVSAADTAALEESGYYNYAIDIASEGVIQTVLEGFILVKEDMSKAT